VPLGPCILVVRGGNVIYFPEFVKWLESLTGFDLAQLVLAALVTMAGLVFWGIRIALLISDHMWQRRSKRLQASIDASNRMSQFDANDIRDSIRYYTVPHCSQEDPSNSSDLRRVADVRENVFSAVSRSVSPRSDKRHLLLLADSGMGKTTFCLNFFSYLEKNPIEGKRPALISLAGRDSTQRIKEVKDKKNVILILDAFDEDRFAIRDGDGRLQDIMNVSSDFYAVIITCRSQFFADDDSIPRETGIKVLTPRKGGDAPTYKLYKSYLMPFTDEQIEEYIHRSFSKGFITDFRKRSEARKYVDEIPELAVRPMLLALLPELVEKKVRVRELYSLYEFMIDSWLNREAQWIQPDNLLKVSKALAVAIYRQVSLQGSDRVDRSTLMQIAATVSPEVSDWEHLKERSLLNRDSEGKFKFAHRSILEFLVVQAAIDGDDSTFDMRWTDLMRQLFVSWGYAEPSEQHLRRAHEILKRDLDRTGLVPLSTPPALPDYVTTADFERSCQRQLPLGGKRKSISPSWRAQTLRYRREGSLIKLLDIENDLEWHIPDWEQLRGSSDLGLFRRNIVELQKIDTTNGGLRLPSYEEFVTLVEAEHALGGKFLARDEFYWVADVAGDRQHLIVTLSENTEFREKMHRVDGPRAISGTTSKISVFELSVFFNPKQFNSYRAIDLRLANRRDPY
jgi:hypothetical protein